MKSLNISTPSWIAALVGAGAMAAVVWGPGLGAADTQPILIEAPAGAPLSFADLIEQVSPAVVSVNVVSEQERADMSEMERFFERFRQGPGAVPQEEEPEPETREARSLGSGFFISREGYVVTNNHVVANATQIQIVLEDGRELEASLVGTDPQTDLAVLKVEESGDYPFVQFGSSAELRRGDWVVALGNPFGLGGTATAGILSADGRDLGNSNPYTDFLQIDAAINRGNSGGPTFDLFGRVVGVNTAIFSPTGGSVGIGFAIPSDLAMEVTSTLIEKGRVSRGWLGVTIQDVTEDMADARGLDMAEGAIVADLVANSPAKKSGIRRGDIIVEVNGQKVTDATSTTRIVGRLPAGSRNRFVVLRDGVRKTISVLVGERPEDPNAVLESTDDIPGEDGVAAEQAPLGLYLRPLDAEMRSTLNMADDEPGLVVERIAPDSPLRELGIQPGMVLLDANNVQLFKVEDLVSAIDAALSRGRDKVLLAIHVGAGTRFVTVDIGDSEN
jgi:serine protease Do